MLDVYGQSYKMFNGGFPTGRQTGDQDFTVRETYQEKEL